MTKKEVVELPDFEYSPKGFSELKTALKAGKLVRNPFARFYGEDVKISVKQDTEFAPRIKKP
jgi:hypothetical protein